MHSITYSFMIQYMTLGSYFVDSSLFIFNEDGLHIFLPFKLHTLIQIRSNVCKNNFAANTISMKILKIMHQKIA